MATPTVTCPHCTMMFWNLRAEQLEAELSAQIAAKRIAQDECLRLEKEWLVSNRELGRQLKLKRTAEAECERLEGELAKAQDMAQIDKHWVEWCTKQNVKLGRELKAADRAKEFADMLSNSWAMTCDTRRRERDEARQVAAGLLRLARALSKSRKVAYWQGGPSAWKLPAEKEAQAALAALPPAVRRLVEG